MRPEDRKPLAYTLLSILVAVAVAVAQMRFPAFLPETLDWTLLACLASIVACVTWLVYEHLGEKGRTWWRRHRMAYLVGMIVCGAGFLGFWGAYLWAKNASSVGTAASDVRLAITRVEFATSYPPDIMVDFSVTNEGRPTIISDWSLSANYGESGKLEDIHPYTVFYFHVTMLPDGFLRRDTPQARPLAEGARQDGRFIYRIASPKQRGAFRSKHLVS